MATQASLNVCSPETQYRRDQIESYISTSGYSLISHTPEELAIAATHPDPQQLWRLRTIVGTDDVLIGTRGEVTTDVLNHLDTDNWPQGWELFEIDLSHIEEED